MSNNKLDWSEIQKDYDSGMNYDQISEKYHTWPATISAAVRRGEFKSRKRNLRNFDWTEIQKEYDSGLSYRDLYEKYKISPGSLRCAVKQNQFVPRSKKEAYAIALKQGRLKRSHDAASRKLISEARIKYLEANPDKVPWRLFHSSKESYPEMVFRTALESSSITGWVAEYQNGIYCYDFAFPDLKIDVEIDGGTHLTEKVLKIDARRDAWSREQGWKVIRFTADKVKNDIIRCIDELKSLL